MTEIPTASAAQHRGRVGPPRIPQEAELTNPFPCTIHAHRWPRVVTFRRLPDNQIWRGIVLRHTIIVEGMLAYRMQRAAAARTNAIGREIATLPQVASRLAGGFVEIADADILFPLIRTALAESGFSTLADVADLPGTPRAVMATLRRAWDADLDLDALADGVGSVADLALIESRLREALPPAWLLPRDLRKQAIEKAGRARHLLGDIVIEGVVDVPPIWRPLVLELKQHVTVEWRTAGAIDRSWFGEPVRRRELTSPVVQRVESCADVRSEVVEALRWAREMLAAGACSAADVAIVAASTAEYDEHMLVLGRESHLPLHFGDGVPALSTRAGQCCAALADILLRGLSQNRVRRLLNALPRRGPLQLLPSDWSRSLRQEAMLTDLRQWQAAMLRSREHRADGDLAERVLFPVLTMLTDGLKDAVPLGEQLLDKDALAIWKDAHRSAPAEALSMSLQQLCVADDTDPANSIAWCSADQLAASPRPVVRMLGLSVKSWPRASADDPLLPDHVLSRRTLQPRSTTERDRMNFAVIMDSAAHLAMSRSRRTSRGGLQAASPLWPKAQEIELARVRVPQHAYSEGDRLLARPSDASETPRVVRTRACWTAWHRPELTPYDGLIAPGHPALGRSLDKTVTAADLRLLLRDPQAFIWTRSLGWRPKRFGHRLLAMDAAAFGELVHELIATSVARLGAMGGVQRTSTQERENVVQAVSDMLAEDWPSEWPVPPPSLWASTLALARRMTLHAIQVDEDLPTSLDSFTELAFGSANGETAPWAHNAEVVLAGTSLRLVGRIDRLDLARSGSAARITDYKTGRPPSDVHAIVMDGGRELQRVLYATAMKQLIPDVGRIVARLLYLGSTADAHALQGDELDQAMADLGRHASAAIEELLKGRALPGPDAYDKFSRYRLALPADLELYGLTKGKTLAEASASLEEGRQCR